MGRLRVGVLFGGRSGEHEISLASARSVMSALDREKYEVVPLGIARDGTWVAAEDPLAALSAGETGSRLRLPAVPLSGCYAAGGEEMLPQVDVVFPVLHGPFGEDGTVQGWLEMADIPYVGAGVMASAVGMDKAVMKSLFRERGLPCVDQLVVDRARWRRAPVEVSAAVRERVGFPCFAKPANLGSSVGISKVHGPEDLAPALDLALALDRKAMVEVAVDARELECGILGNDEPAASAVGEIVSRREFYDYQAKYSEGQAELLVPAPVEPELAEAVRALAVEAFLTIECRGLARVDFFLERSSGRLFVNEINTIPGFTRFSMFPRLWEAAGLPYPRLLDRLIELALEKDRVQSAAADA